MDATIAESETVRLAREAADALTTPDPARYRAARDGWRAFAAQLGEAQRSSCHTLYEREYARVRYS
jgi:hypothetical protein